MEPSPPLPPGPSPPLAKTNKYAIFNPASAPTCRFFNSPQGCAKGSTCQFRHDAAQAKAQFAPSTKPRKPPCRFFLKGQCRNGAQCSFSHENVPAPAPLPDMTQLSIADETVLTRDLLGPFFAIDVECVATGTGHLDRDVARIAIVSENEHTLFDAYVKPAKPVVSYLTQLTGITAAHLEGARTLAEVLTDLRAILPTDSVLVGQSVDKDVAWLGLKAGEDFRAIFDVAMLFRMPNTKSSYRYFSLRHVVKYLLEESIQETDHDPVVDAIYAMKVFKRFRHLHESPAHRHAVLETLAKTPQTPSFAKRHPIIDGVALAPPPPTTS
ncbi:hypothetical protein SPRG_01498 [Saprolegnia parasitica CBS 223.65]|uniref:C3H1-type domain-containing protein n=1 Tax=Saprolegnia parasitica (strain CBS 223.65) TaxID=695850 RepID=A0A067D5T1_SAPPC|nr:hypothetical protein SPRG_01498 [Saprolegnia parasitica CBS 223.65]KDO34362.1 hypothetical protein SPRG_01498 [Saprolegnia parasitica CBS 223.65]|eukprot:XP_012195098.1 hypothetical protein SPRG_01498 [Saprolegnia parasitica CBS 223.65]